MNEPDLTRLVKQAMDDFAAGRRDEAEARLQAVVAENPGQIEAWNALGVIARLAGDPEKAIRCYRRVVAVAPEHPAGWSNMGNAYRDLNRIEAAVACQRRALAQMPLAAGFHHNLGLALMSANRFGEAVDSFSRAILITPDNPQYRWDRALGFLHQGRYAQAWPDYEARFETGELPRRPLAGRRWNGQRFDGQRLLVVSEQGLGDAIWASRFLAPARALGGTIVLECRAELRRWFERQGLADLVIARGEPLPETEWHTYQCSLPGLFTPGPSVLPPVPIPPPPPQDTGRFQKAWDAAQGRLKVGIIWSGSPTFRANAQRSLPFQKMVAALSVPGVALYSLQVGPAAGDIDASVYDLAPLLTDMADTAAALAGLDLVIMTDTSVAHLGGTMGVPVWLLLTAHPYWIWGSEGPGTPWYPSLSLFRQSSRGDWAGVLDAVTARLITMTAK